MSKKSGELQLECQRLGLSTEGTREHMMDRLRDFIVKRDNLNILPQIDVMVAKNAKDFFDYDLEKPWMSNAMSSFWNLSTWVAEVKFDGVRVKAHYHPKYICNPRLDSRRRSDVNYIYSEKTPNFPHLQLDMKLLPPSFHDMILDGEIMPPQYCNQIKVGDQVIDNLNISTSIWNSGMETAVNMQSSATWVSTYLYPTEVTGCLLNYYVFDVIRFNGEWLHEKPWWVRNDIKRQVVAKINQQNPHYTRVKSYYHDSEDNDFKLAELTAFFGEHHVKLRQSEYSNGLAVLIFEHELLTGGEGLMFKYINQKYWFGKRTDEMWKLKRFLDVDAFITGWIPGKPGTAWEGLVGSFKVSVYEGDTEVHIASVSGITEEMRRDASEVDGSLRDHYYRKVVEIRCQQITTKSFRGRHAVFVRFRPDKTPEDCKMDQIKAAPSEMMEE